MKIENSMHTNFLKNQGKSFLKQLVFDHEERITFTTIFYP